MNTKYLLLGLGIVLTACSSDNDEFNATNVPKAQLTISTEIVSTRAYFNTGLKNDIEFANGNQIGYTLIESKRYESYNEGEYNFKAVYNNGQWEIEKPTYVSDKEGCVIAYYPYNTRYDYMPAFLASEYPLTTLHYVPIDISSYAHGDGQQEYLCGESDVVSSASPMAKITFKHVLPRITFVVEKGSKNADDDIYLRSAILTNVTKAGNTICTKGEMNIRTGSVLKDNDGGGSITNSYTAPVLLDPKGETRTFDFLVIPTEVPKDSVILRIEARKGTNGDFKYYEIPIPATKWESGKQYTYPVTLNITEHQQESGETPGEKVYMGFNGDNGKPLYWSSWNLGAKKIEDYGGLYGWGDPTGNHKEHYYDNSLYRDQYYMQDSVTCLSYYGGFKPKYTNNSGTELDVARAKWKSQWRIPTSNEFSKLMSNCTYEWTTYNQVLGFKFVSKINGNSIFLPYAPNRIGSKEEYSEWNTVSGTYNQSTVYWTANVNEKEPFRSTVFYFGNSGYCWNARGAKRYEGLPIRPVTE